MFAVNVPFLPSNETPQSLPVHVTGSSCTTGANTVKDDERDTTKLTTRVQRHLETVPEHDRSCCLLWRSWSEDEVSTQSKSHVNWTCDESRNRPLFLLAALRPSPPTELQTCEFDGRWHETVTDRLQCFLSDVHRRHKVKRSVSPASRWLCRCVTSSTRSCVSTRERDASWFLLELLTNQLKNTGRGNGTVTKMKTRWCF